MEGTSPPTEDMRVNLEGRFYLEGKPMESGGVEINERLVTTDKRGIVGKVLEGVARVRVVQSQDIGGAIVPLAHVGVNTIEARAPEGRTLSGNLSLEVTPTAGRRVFLPDQKWADAIVLPGQVGEFRPRVGVKGLGSSFHQLKGSDLEGTDHIVGMTGTTNERAVEDKLVEGDYLVTDAYGKRVEKSFVPGRYTLGSVGLETVTTADGVEVKVDELDPDKYPLLTNENKPRAVFHAGWSKFNYDDFIYLCSRRTNTKSTSEAEQLGSQFNDWTKEVFVAMQHHPDFASQLEGLSDGDPNFTEEFWARFFVAQLNKDYQEAQIIGEKSIILDKRHAQNFGFGGHQDYEGSKTGVVDQGWCSESHLSQSGNALGEMYRAIFNILDEKSRAVLSERIGEMADKWSDDMVDKDKLSGVVDKLRAGTYGVYDAGSIGEVFKQKRLIAVRKAD